MDRVEHRQAIWYHYTRKESVNGIVFKDGFIRPSVDTQRDACCGCGSYVTTLDPTNSNVVLGKNNYNNPYADEKKMEGFIELSPHVTFRKCTYCRS